MGEYDIHVSFKKGTKAVAKEQFQYNYGEKLIFDDVDLPEYYEVHFANMKSGDAKKVIGDATGAIIPQEYFKPGQIIYAWVFFSNETSGKTVYEIVIPISQRAKPTDEPISPEEKSVVSQAIELLNETVENVEESINSSLEEAKNSGEFDGKDGVDGSTQWISSRAPVNPNYTFYIYALSGTAGSHVKVNDTIFYENNLYQIISVDSFQVRSILLTNLKGDPGRFPESDAFLSDTSRNPVQNRIVKAAIDSKYTKPISGVPAADLSDDVRESLRKADSSADANSVYTKTEIDQKLVGAMTYKGTKARVSDLPLSGNANGDTWHIDEDGSEWAWNGSVWEELGRAVDLSGYRTAAAQDLIDQNQNDSINSKYTKPANGIPKSDLASDVQTSLGKADTALQSAPVTSVNGQTGAVTVSVPSASSVAPLMDGVSSAGSSVNYARADHVHPSDDSKRNEPAHIDVHFISGQFDHIDAPATYGELVLALISDNGITLRVFRDYDFDWETSFYTVDHQSWFIVASRPSSDSASQKMETITLRYIVSSDDFDSPITWTYVSGPTDTVLATQGDLNDYVSNNQLVSAVDNALVEDIQAAIAPVLLLDASTGAVMMESSISPPGINSVYRSAMKVIFGLAVNSGGTWAPNGMVFEVSSFDPGTGQLDLYSIKNSTLYQITLTYDGTQYTGTMTQTNLALPSAQGVSF